jgi:hypothetical protein
MTINKICKGKILNLGMMFPHAVYNMYKIMQLFWTHNMHVLNFLKLKI